MKKVLKSILHFVIFAVLTIFTQLGGLIYLLSLPLANIINRRFSSNWKKRLVKLFSFLGLYFICTLLIIPPLARQFGREPLPLHEGHLQAANVLTVLANRNYVRPRLHQVLRESVAAAQLQHPGLVVNYLDANFPFINGFPMIFHLSHNDGRKIDLSYSYKDAAGKPTNEIPTYSGYGAFEAPVRGEENMPEICKHRGYWQYNIAKNFTLFRKHDNLQLDNDRTRALLLNLSTHPLTEKIFLEPHLKRRLGLSNSKIRFHGCHAARHDDHIHVQIH
jgi:hypothetical protein